MRVVGFGSDLCNIDRIAATLARHGDRFRRRVFTDVEQAYAARRPLTEAATLAKRFAAKEAAAKALGTGIARGVAWRDLGVVNLPTGRPTLALTGGASAALARLLRDGETADLWLTLTDDRPWAFASVLLVASRQSTSRTS